MFDNVALLILAMKLREGGALRAPPSLNFIVGLSSDDNVSKFLIEQYPADFASWLIGEAIALTELSPSELSLEPIRADALILLQSADIVLHCEFQTNPGPTMPFRVADYALRVFRRFPQKRLVQVVIYLRPSDSELVKQNTFTANRLRHEFEVVRLWEQPTEIFLQRPGLLPYAVLRACPKILFGKCGAFSTAFSKIKLGFSDRF